MIDPNDEIPEDPLQTVYLRLRDIARTVARDAPRAPLRAEVSALLAELEAVRDPERLQALGIDMDEARLDAQYVLNDRPGGASRRLGRYLRTLAVLKQAGKA